MWQRKDLGESFCVGLKVVEIRALRDEAVVLLDVSHVSREVKAPN